MILDDYQDVALAMADWSRLADRVSVESIREHITDPDRLVERLAAYDIVVAMRERTPLPRDVLERLPALRLIVTTGVRNPVIDVDACRDLGITLCNTGGSRSATAELTWGLILSAFRGLPREIASVRDGGWMVGVGRELSGATLGVVGLGRLGSATARVGLAFGMHVVAWSEHLSPERCAEVGVELAGKEILFAESDVVSIHLVLSDRTRGLVGEWELRAMKPNAWLVNTSRAPIVDSPALLRACSEGWIAGAALDVYDEEPLPVDSPWRRLDNVIATPHIGYVTQGTYREWFATVVDAIAAFLDGAPINVVS